MFSESLDGEVRTWQSDNGARVGEWMDETEGGTVPACWPVARREGGSRRGGRPAARIGPVHGGWPSSPWGTCSTWLQLPLGCQRRSQVRSVPLSPLSLSVYVSSCIGGMERRESLHLLFAILGCHLVSQGAL